jgi:hypothetical protein
VNLEELEVEIGQTVVDAIKNPSPQVARMAVYYIMEVVKRYRTKGITRVRVRQLAEKATERRIRNEDALQLKEMLNNAGDVNRVLPQPDDGGATTPDGAPAPNRAGTVSSDPVPRVASASLDRVLAGKEPAFLLTRPLAQEIGSRLQHLTLTLPYHLAGELEALIQFAWPAETSRETSSPEPKKSTSPDVE